MPKKGKESPYFKDRTGEKHFNTEGYEGTIIECLSSTNNTIKFNDERGTIVCNKSYRHIVKGNFKNPYHPSVHGIGYFGIGKHKARIGNERTKEYRYWKGMMERGCSSKLKQKYPSYKEIKICEEFICFQNFGAWFEENYKPEYMQGWHLDKDILAKRNKIYSPDTCCFVPPEINTLFTTCKSKRGDYPIGVTFHKRDKKFCAQLTAEGKDRHLGYFDTVEEAFQAYKVAKETYIKEVADKWRPLISEKVYKAMYNWIVEITD